MFLLLFGSVIAIGQSNEHFVFAYFTGNGEDGLHFLRSDDGFQWSEVAKGRSLMQPELGDEKLLRDPCVIRGADQYFHVVYTIGWHQKGIGYSRSKDLINWEPQQYIPVMEDYPTVLNCWAPEITFDILTEQYYIYWASTIEGAFLDSEGSSENNYNHRLYYTTTYDFVDFTPTQLFFDPAFNVIDGSLLYLDSVYILFIKNETKFPNAEKNIRYARSAQISGPYTSVSAPMTGNYWAEGPTATNINNQIIVVFDKYRSHQMGAIETTDLETWHDISEIIKFPPGIRHGSVLKIDDNTAKRFNNLTDSISSGNK